MARLYRTKRETDIGLQRIETTGRTPNIQLPNVVEQAKRAKNN